MLEILFFAIVAAFLGWRLYSVLGRRTGHEKPFDPFRTKDTEAPATLPERDGNVRHLPEPPARHDRADRERRKLEAAIGAVAGDVRRGLDAIRNADPKFDPVDFVVGARVAFDMIVNEFAQGDTKALRPLLNDQVYSNFTAAIEERNRNKHRHETTVVGILSADIAAAELKGDEAQVAVKFVSQQINVTKDQEGRIIDGDPSEVANITDIWTFARSIKSRDPNWVLVATESPL
ncbi:Tim44/TimA family putative adaptor protein [Dongia deserti]|uniref:Tim44/TimA family putative adaptor protein n=1 Tax=Dongia deserti TaxID=2268030 RepID=UPI000E656006|nr:Tim44/TimA family putative adaptor protein [Dongia deserti]